MIAIDPDVLVIGAGVSGLSTAIAMLDAGIAVGVYASEPPQRTTSAVAGALWGPHMVGADERIGRWAGLTLDWFRELADRQAAGVRILDGMVASSAESDLEPPPFTVGAGPMTRCGTADLPADYISGWQYSAPVVEMPVYLDFLLDLLIEKGGKLQIGRPVRSLADAGRMSAARVIVNCAGIGARDLVPDATLVPVRGQVVVVANPGLSGFFVGEGEDIEEIAYFFSHGPTVLLGGTHQTGNMSRLPEPVTAERILARCAAVEPKLAGAHVLAHRAGLRPVRPNVRLEAQPLGGGRHLLHNYGHGGAGVTLSWGCAQDAAREVATLLS